MSNFDTTPFKVYFQFFKDNLFVKNAMVIVGFAIHQRVIYDIHTHRGINNVCYKFILWILF